MSVVLPCFYRVPITELRYVDVNLTRVAGVVSLIAIH